MQDIVAAAVMVSAISVGYKSNNIYYPYARPREKPQMTTKQQYAREATKRQRKARKKQR